MPYHSGVDLAEEVIGPTKEPSWYSCRLSPPEPLWANLSKEAQHSVQVQVAPVAPSSYDRSLTSIDMVSNYSDLSDNEDGHNLESECKGLDEGRTEAHQLAKYKTDLGNALTTDQLKSSPGTAVVAPTSICGGSKAPYRSFGDRQMRGKPLEDSLEVTGPVPEFVEEVRESKNTDRRVTLTKRDSCLTQQGSCLEDWVLTDGRISELRQVKKRMAKQAHKDLNLPTDIHYI